VIVECDLYPLSLVNQPALASYTVILVN